MSLLLIFFTFHGCMTREEAQKIDPDVYSRAKKEAAKGGGLMGNIGKKEQNNTFDFATSNIMWRATLKTIDFMPLANVDYSGGIIVTDWYSDLISNEQIKLNITFLSSELRSDSIQVLAFKKICNNQNNCITKKVEGNFNNEIKESILNTARLIKIEEQKKSKN